MKIIGLGHYSRTGKDTFANGLMESLKEMHPRLAVKKIPFAWKLKDICHQLYAWAGLREAEFYETPEGEPLRSVVLPAIGKTPVEIWVDMGTPAVREQVYQNTWIDYVMKGVDCDVLIVPDVRFYNEVTAMREGEGTLLKVVRPGYGPRESKADRELLCYRGWDYVIGASGAMAELRDWSAKFATYITGGKKPVQSDVMKELAYQVETVQPCVKDEEWAWLKPGWEIVNNQLRYLVKAAA